MLFFRAILLWVLCLSLVNATEIPKVQLPSQLSGDNVLVLFKQHDSFSEDIARYYAKKRNIPLNQLIAVDIAGSPNQISAQKFEEIYTNLAPSLTENIKIIVMTWNAPYRVDCMSITSAFTLGFDTKYCGNPTKEIKGCHKTANNSFFNSDSSLLWQEDIRLSMMLSGINIAQAKALIDRGVAADNTHPDSNAYLVRTHDYARSTRSLIFKQFSELWGNRGGIHVHYIEDLNTKKNLMQNKSNVMFYHTGLPHVPAITTNQYLPGAIADHLTSAAGIGIDYDGQMKAFRWLEAGLTGSYGTVVEPCNYTEKFPNPQVLIPFYHSGDSLIEAYWKSVQQPGEGLFIGEPLARPWSKTMQRLDGDTLVIYSENLNHDKSYTVESRTMDTHPQWEQIKAYFSWHERQVEIRIPNAEIKQYRIVENK